MAGNIIQQSIISRADRLLASVREAESITQPSECGALYEAYIRRFLEDIAPRKCDLRSGFVTDAYGTVSPQIDLMGIDATALPPVGLDSRSVICPIESLRFFIEVKATVKSAARDQIEKQVDKIGQMYLHFVNPQQICSWQPPIKCPAFLIGYKSEVNESTLKEWVDTIPELFCVVIVGEYAMWKDASSGDVAVIRHESESGKNE